MRLKNGPLFYCASRHHPLCYFIKINSIADIIPSSFQTCLFIDEFSISCSSRNMASIEKQLHLCLNKVEKWAVENGFYLFIYLGYYVAFNTVQVIS